MILLYEGASLLFNFIVYVLAIFVIIGAIVFLVGIIWGYKQNDYKNKITKAGFWIIFAPILMAIVSYVLMALMMEVLKIFM